MEEDDNPRFPYTRSEIESKKLVYDRIFKADPVDVRFHLYEDPSVEDWKNGNEWLITNSNDEKIFNKAVFFQDKNFKNFSILHWIVWGLNWSDYEEADPSELIQTWTVMIEIIITKAPKTVFLKCDDGNMPLHHAIEWQCSHSARLIAKHAPKAIKEPNDKHGDLPLHLACRWLPRDTTLITDLLTSAPQTLQTANDSGRLPLHYACDNGVHPKTLKAMVIAYEEAITKFDMYGRLPIHALCDWCQTAHAIRDVEGDFLVLLDIFLKAQPQSAYVEDRSKQSPITYLREIARSRKNEDFSLMLHKASSGEFFGGFSVNLVKLLLQAFPESCMIKDENGMIPLHHACSNNAAHSLDIVVALLEASPPESSTVTDKQGRTPSQILKPVASHKDERGMLLLHHLAAHSKSFCANFLNLLISAYPESIAVQDNHGMLPFHHACLNTALSLDVLMLFVKSNPACMISATKLSIASNTLPQIPPLVETVCYAPKGSLGVQVVVDKD
jgi:ankyrin repeat protein